MVDQIVGVADTAGVNLHRRIGREGVVATTFVGLGIEGQAGDRGGIDAENRSAEQALDPPQPTAVGCAHRAVATNNQVQLAARPEGQAVGRVILARARQIDHIVLHALQVRAAKPRNLARPVGGIGLTHIAMRDPEDRVGRRRTWVKGHTDQQACAFSIA